MGGVVPPLSPELADPVVVEFPLRGEGWMAVTTPAFRVPSHGTDMLGQRFAYDFVKVDERPGAHFHPAGTLRGELFGGRTQEAYAWNQPVHAPLAGTVLAASDGMPERQWIHPALELFHMVKNAATFTPEKLGSILGNHVILQANGVVAAFAHFTPGSVSVEVGQTVAVGDLLGRVGHTGNSTSPHLHFQLMDSADPLVATGIPAAFRAYDVLRDGAWVAVADGIPGSRERLRFRGE